jgi:hydroxylaminobenzene mutase
MMESPLGRDQQRRLAMHGFIILFMGLLSGIGFSYAAATMMTTDPAYGAWRFAHMEGIVNGLLLLAVAGIWLRLNIRSPYLSVARVVLVLGCYANIIGPILNALFIGRRLIMPETVFEAIVVYGFYILGTLPLLALPIFVINLYRQRNAMV